MWRFWPQELLLFIKYKIVKISLVKFCYPFVNLSRRGKVLQVIIHERTFRKKENKHNLWDAEEHDHEWVISFPVLVPGHEEYCWKYLVKGLVANNVYRGHNDKIFLRNYFCCEYIGVDVPSKEYSVKKHEYHSMVGRFWPHNALLTCDNAYLAHNHN